MNFFMKTGNFFNKIILYSPFHALASRNTLLISFIGRKSGKVYTTPVNYAQDGSIVRITSGTDRRWWRNLKATPAVKLQLRGKGVKGTAQVFEEQQAVADELGAYLSNFPQSARYFGVRIEEDGSFNQDDLLKASKNRVMVRIQLDE